MIAFWFTDSVGFRCIMLICGWVGCLDSRFSVAGAVGQVSWCCDCCAFRFVGFGVVSGCWVVLRGFGVVSGFGFCGI